MLERDRTVLLSERYIPLFLELGGGVESYPVQAIPNPVPFLCEDLELNNKQNRVLFVGRLQNAQKRVDLLLRIWRIVEHEFTDWCLDIVGDGIDRLRLERLSVELGLKRVVFYGHQTPERFYKRSKIFTMTSEYEGFPMVLTEAVAYGCVPIAFDSYASARDIIEDGETGYLIPPFDCVKYADVLRQLMKSDTKRLSIAQELYRTVEKYSIKQVGSKWITLFEELLA